MSPHEHGISAKLEDSDTVIMFLLLVLLQLLCAVPRAFENNMVDAKCGGQTKSIMANVNFFV